MAHQRRARGRSMQQRRAVRGVAAALATAAVLALAACSGGNNHPAATSPTHAPAVASPTTGTSVATAAAASATPPTTPTPTPAARRSTPTPAVGTGTPSGADQAVMAVIQRADREQQQALAQRDPTVMRDTATPAYYTELVQTLRDLANGGVDAIKLLALEWGPVTVQGTSAQATSFETWQATFVDGTATQSRDRNVYTLVQQGGQWLVAADDHPDTHLNQPAPNATPGAPGAPVPPSSAPAGASQSRNWAGYAASGGPFTAVSASWTVPQVQASGTSGGADATWVGIGGVNSTDLIQAGTTAIAVGPGQVQYSAWMETLPQPSQPVTLVIHPGDAVSVSLTQQAGGAWQISIMNQTTSQQFQTTVQYSSSLSSAEWIEEAPSSASVGLSVVTLDNFGSVQVQNATATTGGTKETIAQAGGQPIVMYGRGGQPLAAPSALSAAGSGFTVTRLTAGSPLPQIGH